MIENKWKMFVQISLEELRWLEVRTGYYSLLFSQSLSSPINLFRRYSALSRRGKTTRQIHFIIPPPVFCFFFLNFLCFFKGGTGTGTGEEGKKKKKKEPQNIKAKHHGATFLSRHYWKQICIIFSQYLCQF